MSICDKCFNKEIESFSTQTDFEKFDLELTKKIANDKSIKMRQFVNIEGEGIGYQVYDCNLCGQLWKLQIPDNSSRGYFLRLIKQNFNQ